METRDRIVAAASAAFSRAGLEGLSLRDVAREVGITPMAIYRHFENKQALVDALVLEGLAAWSQIALAVPKGEPIGWLRRIGDAYLEFALRQPRRFEAAFLIASRAGRRYPDDFAAGHSPAGSLQMGIIEQAIAQGELVKVAPMEVLIMLASTSQGLITLYRAGRIAGGEKEFRALFKRVMRRCLQSFAAGEWRDQE
jgi:AcrR family transcriptional regulator